MNYNVHDKVSFAGDVDNGPLAETTVAYVNANAHQVIIEHPNGHLGNEYTNLALDPRKKYVFAKMSAIKHWVATPVAETTAAPAAEKIQTVASEAVNETASTEPLSKVLTALRAMRPETEDDLFDKFIEQAAKREAKAEEKAANNEKEKRDKEITAQATAGALADSKEDEKLSQETLERLKKEENQRLEIIAHCQLLKEKNVITEVDGVFSFLGRVLQVWTAGSNNPWLDLANYFQNDPTDLALLLAEVEKQKNGTAGPVDAGKSFKEITEENNRKHLEEKEKTATEAKKEVESTNENNTSGSDTGANMDKGAAPKTEETKSKPKAEGVDPEYAEKIIALKGVGKVAAEKILKAYATPKLLMAAIKEKTLPFTEKVNEALKNAGRTKWFKERA